MNRRLLVKIKPWCYGFLLSPRTWDQVPLYGKVDFQRGLARSPENEEVFVNYPYASWIQLPHQLINIPMMWEN